jgi:hypothetical protein
MKKLVTMQSEVPECNEQGVRFQQTACGYALPNTQQPFSERIHARLLLVDSSTDDAAIQIELRRSDDTSVTNMECPARKDRVFAHVRGPKSVETR